MFEEITWNLPGIEIERKSFRQIEQEYSDKERWNETDWPIVRRLIHTTADFSIANTLKLRHNPIQAGIDALYRGATIYSDSNMIKAGLSIAKLQKFNLNYRRESIICPIADKDVAKLAKKEQITRALAAIRINKKLLNDSIFISGNAPLALAGMIKLFIEENIKPALIIGMPVGFVNVVESKALLRQVSIPHVTIEGRRGGSPLAVATLHAIMENELTKLSLEQ